MQEDDYTLVEDDYTVELSHETRDRIVQFMKKIGHDYYSDETTEIVNIVENILNDVICSILCDD